MVPSRVWVTSDIHIDYQDNFNQLMDFARRGHRLDVLIIAGDATDRLDKLEYLFDQLVPCFYRVMFVPGNHELWIRRSDFADSVEKFNAIQALCHHYGVQTEPLRLGQYQHVWLVPLQSWYDDKQFAEHTLFMEKTSALDRTDDMWGDFFHTRWPASIEVPLAQWFAQHNEPFLNWNYDAPVISFSHFLPRQELIFGSDFNRSLLAKMFDPHPEFNFTRVAGSLRIHDQIRRLGSQVHVYGHQHRNRVRELDGVTYVSHCMGYPRERQMGFVKADAREPRCLWREDTGFCI